MNSISKVRQPLGSYTKDIKDYIDEFNNNSSSKFHAESRVLIPANEDDRYKMDTRGIIIEYNSTNREEFETDFNENFDIIEKFAKKLDKRTSLFQRKFYSEFCDINAWNEWNNMIVAYNLEI